MVEGNFIGTDITGSKPLPTNILTVVGFPVISDGVTMNGSGDTLGGTTPPPPMSSRGTRAGRVSGSRPVPDDPGASGLQNLVEGNLIGTDPTGKKAVPNGAGGVFLPGTENTIGGTTAAAHNVISGNDGSGVSIPNASNVIQGNYIGTDITGVNPLGNYNGVDDNGVDNVVGGTTPGAGNVIAGNTNDGLVIDSKSAGNVTKDNLIGVAADSDAPLGNGNDGVYIQGVFSGGNQAIAGSTATIETRQYDRVQRARRR